MSSRFEDAVQRGGEALQLKCEATGHSASALRQHLEMNVSSLPPVFFLYSAGTEPMRGPMFKEGLPSSLNSLNTSDTPRDVSHL